MGNRAGEVSCHRQKCDLTKSGTNTAMLSRIPWGKNERVFFIATNLHGWVIICLECTVDCCRKYGCYKLFWQWCLAAPHNCCQCIKSYLHADYTKMYIIIYFTVDLVLVDSKQVNWFWRWLITLLHRYDHVLKTWTCVSSDTPSSIAIHVKTAKQFILWTLWHRTTNHNSMMTSLQLEV